MRQPKTICEICGKVFENGNQLRAHKSCHSKKEFTCKICNEKIIGASQYKIHLGNHKIKKENNQKCECKICGKKYNTLAALHGHMASHKENKILPHTKKYKCIHCDKEFLKQDYINHIITLINNNDEYLIYINGHLKYENKYFIKCRLCGIDKFDLNNHLINFHNVNPSDYLKRFKNTLIKAPKKINITNFQINKNPPISIKPINLLLARGIMNNKESFINSITPDNVIFSDTLYYVSKIINNKKIVKNPDFIVVDKNYLDIIKNDITLNGKISLKNYKYIIGLIEHFGEYWHGPKVTGKSKEEHEKEILDLYKLCNKKCLIIWESEVINKDKEKLQSKINSFLNNL